MKQPVKFAFITNPVSGNKKRKPDAPYIRQFFDSASDIVFFESKKPGHATELAAEAISGGANVVIAIGGDGTVNEIARILNGTSCALGIIPCGSGNGLARHHRISMNIPRAIDCIKKMHVIRQDAISINGQLSFNVSGIGFDAHVAHLFGKDGRRGFNTYVKLVFREFAGYKEQVIRIDTGGEVIRQKVMLAAIANASQFGNNAVIAPAADTSDGVVDITLVTKMNGWQLPGFMFDVFSKKVGNSRFSKLIRGEKFGISCDHELPLHLDGEPAGFSKTFDVKVLKQTLNIIVPYQPESFNRFT